MAKHLTPEQIDAANVALAHRYDPPPAVCWSESAVLAFELVRRMAERCRVE